jgi:hypothetical protein
MPSTNFDILHTRFAARVNDPAAANANGDIFSILERSRYLNQATNYLSLAIYNSSPDLARKVLNSIVNTQAITAFSSSGYALPADYNQMPISLVKTNDTSFFIYHPRKEELDANTNPNLVNVYTIEGGKLYAYQSGTILNTGAGSFRYIGMDVGVEGTTDIAISSNLWDLIVDIAVLFALEEIGQLPVEQAYMSKVNLLLSAIKGQ